MEPITREEYYLAKIAGTWEGNTPEPVTIEEYYLATMAGDYSGNAPQPVTRLQYYMAKAAGVYNGDVPAPVTRLEYYWAAIAGKEGHIPDPVTRQEHLLYAISQSNNDVINTVSGSTIIINDATEGRPFRGLRVFGKSTQDGTPTPEAPVPIVSVGDSRSIKVEVMGKNLFDINSLKKYEVDNNDLKTSVDNDKIVLERKGVTTTEVIFFCLNKTDDLLKLNPGKYTLSFKSNMPMGTAHKSKTVEAFAIIKKADGSSDYSSTGNKGWTTFDIAEGDMMYFRFDINNGTMTAEFYDIQLEYGSSATAYEPYRTPQILTLQTPNGLPGVPVSKDGNYTDSNGQQWVCDEIDLERGKYVQWVAEKDVLEAIPSLWSGAGKWGNNDGYKTLAFYAYINGANSNKDWGAVKNYGICNYATITSNVFNNSIIGFSLGDYIAFRVSRNLLPDWDENNPSNDPWVNWLKARKEAGNPVIVLYALATPIERDLTPEEIAAYKALRTYGPTTVITNDAGAGMEVTYVVER